MSEQDQITILHLSDLQFGPNHRFQKDAGSLDDRFESLRQRLELDLLYLKRDFRLLPNLLIISGDLSEQGKKEEFIAAFDFIGKIGEYLHLNTERIVIIPGNHDINRDLCAGYHYQCAGRSTPPIKPYWPKWDLYAEQFSHFYRNSPGIEFTPDAPWTIFPIEEMRVVIAGLNSTMAESHLPTDHFGELGERQCRCIADLLRPYHDMRWLRIGVLHHHIRSLHMQDNEWLHDVEILKQHLGLTINILLHGHTHQTGRDVLDINVPIYSTGSSAVKDASLPPYTPNQFQILVINENHIQRYTRCYLPESKTFAPDPRGSINKQDWISSDPVIFRDVNIAPIIHGYISIDEGPGTEEGLYSSFIPHTTKSAREHYLKVVKETCMARNREAIVNAIVLPNNNLFYLRVSESINGLINSYPVAAIDHAPKKEEVDYFISEVVDHYRAHEPYTPAEIVYGGNNSVSEDVNVYAIKRNIKLFSFVEYLGLIDFRKYIEKQTRELSNSTEYPRALYVPQAISYEIGETRYRVEDAKIQIREWLLEREARFILILSDFGLGKTFLLRQLACDLSFPESGIIPLFIELRALEKTHSFDALIASHLASQGMRGIDLEKFHHMVKNGRVVLLFDGFDELTTRVSYDRALEHFDTLIESVEGEAKVIVTSRTSHFENDKQVRKKLAENATRVGTALRYCRLHAFDEERIKLFLQNRFIKTSEADLWFELLKDVNDLLGLAQYPRMLSFITDLNRQELEDARNHEGKITAAILYRNIIVNKWLGFEFDRLNPRDNEPTLSKDQRLNVAANLACMLWKRSERFASIGELTYETTKLLNIIAPEKSAQADEASHQIGSGTLLIRDDEGHFSFAHQSIMEWLVAYQAAWELDNSEESDILRTADFTLLMCEFLLGLQNNLAINWSDRVLTSEKDITERMKRNALLIRDRIQPIEITNRVSSLDLSGQDLRDQELSNLDLRNANLCKANLSDAHLEGSDLSGANLNGALLIRTNLLKANLSRTSMEEVNFSEACLMGAIFHETILRRSIGRRAKLISADIDSLSIKNNDLLGASLSLNDIPVPYNNYLISKTNAIAWHPNLNIIASAHSDGAIRLWDVDSNTEIKRYETISTSATSLAFNAEGSIIVGGYGDGSVYLWDIENRESVRIILKHRGQVRSVAISTKSLIIASGGEDGKVRIRDLRDKSHSTQTTHGHEGAVNSVVFNPNGSEIISGGNDGEIRIWDIYTGEFLSTFAQLGFGIQCLSFNNDGSILAVGCEDMLIHLWDIETRKELFSLDGNINTINSLAISRDNKVLLSASEDMTICVWDLITKTLIRKIKEHKGPVNCITFSPDNKSVASSNGDGTIRIWNVDDWKTTRQIKGKGFHTYCVDYNSEGTIVASGGADGRLRLWDMVKGRQKRHFDNNGSKINCLAFTHHNSRVACSGEDGIIHIWDMDNNEEELQINYKSGSINSISINSTDRIIASGGEDGSIHFYDNVNRRGLRSIDPDCGSINIVRFSPDGRTIAFCGEGGVIQLWDFEKFIMLQSYQMQHGSVNSISFSPDGKLLACGDALGFMNLYDMEGLSEAHHLEFRLGSINSLSFKPNGNIIASGDAGGAVRLWNVGSRRQTNLLNAHRGPVYSVVFSPNGRNLVSCGRDGVLRLWDTINGNLIASLLGLQEGWIIYTPKGRYRAEGNITGEFWHAINLCRFEPGELDEFMPHLQIDPEENIFQY